MALGRPIPTVNSKLAAKCMLHRLVYHTWWLY